MSLHEVRLSSEGRIAAGLGEADRAEEAFQEVRRALVGQGIGYDAARVSLELTAHARQGRTEERKELAGEMLPIFQAADDPARITFNRVLLRRLPVQW